MSSVDSRIVTMKFDNKQFESGAATTMSTLDKLKASLNFSGASKGLDELAGSTDAAEGKVGKLSAGFVALSTIAITALSNMTLKAMALGQQLIGSMSGIEAMKAGFSDYELKVGATQTIMAGTGENIGTVTKYLKELDIYADKTIYSLSDMTSNIGKFTNAGVKLPVAVEAMKGISNVAALSGANAEEAARAMYNLGQAIGNGAVKLMDWKSVELANMGTKEFKEELIKAAIAAGTLTKGVDGVARTAKGKEVDFKTFNGTLAEGWLTAEALTDTLSNYADETTDIGKRAYAAAQDVKTFSMMMETLSAAAGTGWTDTFEILIGNLPEATELWTGLTNTISGFITASADARNKVLGDWKALGGRTALIDGIKNVWNALGSVLKPIKDAFREIFPPSTGKQLFEITERFRDFTKKLAISGETADNLKSIFKGIFSIFSVAWQIISGVASAIGGMFGAISKAASGAGGGFLSFAAGIADMVSGFNTFLKNSGLITKVFNGIGTAIGAVLGYVGKLVGAFTSLFTGDSNTFLDNLSTKFAAAAPIIDDIRSKIQGLASFFKGIAGGIGSLFGGGDAKESASGINTVNASLEKTTTLLDLAKKAWQVLVDGWSKAKSTVSTALGKIGDVFGGIKDKIKETYGNIGLQDILSIINTGFFIALFKTIRDFTKNIGGLIDSFSGVLEQVTDNLKAMEKDVKAKAILKIAIALGLLAIAVLILANIDIKDLAKSLGALVVMLIVLTKGLKALESEEGATLKSGARMVVLAGALILLSIAMIALALALKIIASIDPIALLKGLLALAVILKLLTMATQEFSKSGGAKELLIASASLLILSFALMALAAALQIWDALDASTIVDSMWKIIAVLGAIGLAMRAMPKDMLQTAAGVLILSAALVIISVALKMLGSLSIEEIAKSLITLGIAMVILKNAMKNMQGIKDDAIGMLILAAAVLVLAFAIKTLGSIPLGNIAKALGTLVAVFVILGLAAYFLGPLVPIIQALAVAVLILGAAMLAVGLGLMAFSIGLATLSTLGVAAITTLLELLPLFATQAALALVAFIKVIGDSAEPIAHAIGQVITAMINQVRKLLPQIPPLMSDMLDTFIEVMTDAIPKLARAAIKWLLAILDAIADNIYRVTTTVGRIITEFLNGLADALPDIIDAGARLLVKFLKGISKNLPDVIDAAVEVVLSFINGVADAIRDHNEEIKEAGRNIASAILGGITSGLTGGAGAVISGIRSLMGRMIGGAKDELDAHSPSRVFMAIGGDVATGMAIGITAYSDEVEIAAQSMADTAIDTVKDTMSQISDALNTDTNFAPVIAPVLDLTALRQGASQIGSVVGTSLGTGISFNRATTLSNDYKALQEAAFQSSGTAPETIIQFEQNNYSPKELSSVQIYRQTKNQLSLAKEALSA